MGNGFIYLGVPSYSGKIPHGHLSAIWQASKDKVGPLDVSGISALTFNFNIIFSKALNMRSKGITHFAMMHDDIVPPPFWLDKLYDLMVKHEADMISAIVPIKDSRGLTSTAVFESCDGSDPYWRPKRLTLTEVFQLPPTFTHPKLLLNTGLMLIDITKPWVDGMFFEFEDRIVKDEKGDYRAQFVPEDWNFSRRALERGATLFATREIELLHLGGNGYHNHHPWGTMEKDFVDNTPCTS